MARCQLPRAMVTSRTAMEISAAIIRVKSRQALARFRCRWLHPGRKLWMATTKAKHVYTEVAFGPDDYIMFGKESAGIPEEILVENEDTCIRIPMLDEIRSLNLSNSVAIVLYEALRQNHFDGMLLEGELHRLHWKE